MHRSPAMALRSSSTKISAVCATVRKMASGARAFSTEVRQQEPTMVFVDQKKTRPKWQKLFTQDKRYPFPGDVTSKTVYEKEQTQELETRMKKITLEDILDRRANEVKREVQVDEDGASKLVELKAMDCPKLLKKDLKELFKGVDALESDKPVSVLNLTQKTMHDMSVWSMEMELERLQLTSGFIESALTICSALKRCGYWADFIDPSSGRPYLGKYTNSTLCDTDDRYRSLGFRVTDLGCCKVLEHGSWGTKAFVGTIFTNAPIHSPALSEILAQAKE